MTTTRQDVPTSGLEDELQRAVDRLAAAGVPDPAADARALLDHVLARSDGSAPTGGTAERLRGLVERRAERVPLEHLLGRARFRGLELLVGPGVFVPQPETGVVVDAVVAELGRLRAAGVERPVVVDLCCGSGTVAWAVAHEASGAGVPGVEVHGVEADPAALGWAERNREHLGLPVALHLGSAEDALPALDGRVDVVVSNPPYVAEHELPATHPEVHGHDPLRALVAGADGLDVVRLVERTAWRLARPGGLVVVEHSDRQGRTAPAVFAPRWHDVEDRVDHEGRDRVVLARRP